jgi:hypothetical protein
MPVAVVQEWLEDETDRSTTNYDAIHERLMRVAARPNVDTRASAVAAGDGALEPVKPWPTTERATHDRRRAIQRRPAGGP